jgi:hypothetical protein
MAAMRQEVNAPLIVTVGVLSTLILIVVMFGTEAWFVKEERDEIAEKWEVSKNEQLATLLADQRAKISGIDNAIKKIVETGGKLPATQPAPKRQQK